MRSAAALPLAPAPLRAGLRAASAAEPDLWGRTAAAGARRAAEAARARARAAPAAASLEADEADIRPPVSHESFAAPAPSQLIKDKRAFVEEHRIRGYEAGPDQRVAITTVANLLQEVASNHAVAMWGRSERGFAADPALAAEGLIFVMTRMQVQMDAYPRWGDVVAAETWFQAAGKIGAQRDWVLRDKASGRVLGRATSTWVMINMHTRRLAKMPDSVRRRLDWFQLAPPEFAIPPEATRAKLPDLDPPPAAPGAPPLLSAPRQVARRSDMDMNGHINNVTYVAWALESIPAEVASGAHLYQVEIDYKAECHAGDVVEGVAQRAPAPGAAAANGAGADALAFVHALRRCEAGGACATELVRARTTWRLGGPVA